MYKISPKCIKPFFNELIKNINQYLDSLSDQNSCNADWLYIETCMNFSAGLYDVVCTRKININWGDSVNMHFPGAYHNILYTN